MTQVVDLGKLRFYWAGNYNDLTEYELNDVVRYGGNVYVYINVVRTIGNEPTNPSYWAMMVEGINFIGEWNAGTQYFIGDAVAYGSTVYVSLADNINKRPDLFPSIWSQFVEAIQFEGVYSPTTTYQPNDVVSYGPSTYIAIQTTNGNNPTNATFWSPFVQGISPEGVYNGATAYVPGQVVAYGANLYVCTANTTGNVPTNTSYWELFVDTIRTRGDWTTATLYYVNDIVTYGGNTYICLIQNTSSVFATDLAANRWEVFNGGVRWRGAWASSTPYLTNDIVRNVGSSYIATEDFTSGPNFSVEYDAGKWVFFAQGGDDVLPVITPGLEGYSLTVAANGIDIDWINATGSTNVFYVSPDGDNTNPGTSMALPFANIKNAVAAVPVGQPATIFVKTGVYAESQLPIIVPPTVAIVGDNQRTVIVQPAPGLAADGVTPNNQATMFLMSNASILNRMTFSGMTGWVPGGTPGDIRTSTPRGIVAALNPASPVTTKSPYILECSAIGSGCIGALIDGTAQASGYKSMLFHGYTIITDNGVGYWAKDGGRAEIVSCFTYYAYFGYSSSGGGIIRALNGNNSYGTWGSASFGFLASEVPHTGALYGKQLTVTLDPIVTGFAVGSTVTGQTSGATGVVTNLQASAAKIYYNQTSVTNFQNGEVINDGLGNTLTITGDGVSNQKGYLLVANGFNDAPQPGASIQIAGDSSAYVIQSVSGTFVDSSSVLSLALAQEKLTPSAPGAVVTVRYGYSQIRLTGHDFLNIGTGGIATTNYPGVPTQPPAQGNEVNEDLPGRVYYVSTDQDGNFRVGEYFRVDQATGTATLNANAFNLAGLTSLRLGSIGAQLGETINEFSSDVTMSGNSNAAVPTEFAVRGFVENRVPQALPTSVGETGKYLVSNGATVGWTALSLSEIVGLTSVNAQTGTAATTQYSIFSNTVQTPVTWSLTGTVPSGVSINSSTGVLTVGSGTAAGTYSAVNVRAVGAENSGTLNEPITITVNGAYPLFSSTTLPGAVTPSSSFSSTATQATALSGTVVHTVTAGALPGWLTLASNGVLSGTAPASPANTFIGPFNFTVTATNGSFSNARAYTWTPYLGVIQGQVQYTSSGTYSWIAPTGVTSVSVVAVGAGGGGQDNWANPCGSGGGLGWKNNIPVTPGQAYTVVVGAGGQSTPSGASPTMLGGNSYFISLATVSGYGGGNASGVLTGGPNANGYGGGWVGDGGGAGGNAPNYQGGGGAGGYTARGGNGYETWQGSGTVGGAYGGSYYSSTYGTGAGGGVGLQGPTGWPSPGNAFYNPFTGYNNTAGWGNGGSGAHGGGLGMYGENPFSGQGQSSSNIQGGDYGGGGGGPGTSWPSAAGNGGVGAVRIMWGAGRAYPGTNATDVTPSGPA
jgi:hypothetical protein